MNSQRGLNGFWVKKCAVVILTFVMTGMLSGCCIKHNYALATCTQAETCVKCGKTRGEALGHSYKAATCEKPEICTRCNNENGKPLGHDYDAATCTEDAVCKRCGTVIEEALGHDLPKNICGDYGECLRCKEKVKGPDHTWVEATCSEPATCSNCGKTKGKPLGHNLISGKCTRCPMNLGTLDEIKKLKGLVSLPEKDEAACLVKTDAENPYDVVYDYGDLYNQYVEACDWSYVFDAEYYKKQFPMLAMLYNNDDKLLLKHFQTVGVHEGRQGSKNFNVGAYLLNCDDKVYNAFSTKETKNYECYYIYYMLNYDQEKNVNTVSADNGKTVKTQYRVVLTYAQKKELEEINNYRKEVGSDPVKINSEMNAIANYRSYIDLVEGYEAHDWAINNNPNVQAWISMFKSSSYGENMIQADYRRVIIGYEKYYNSEEHRETMLNNKYKFVGLSNTYTGKKHKEMHYNTQTFDVYFTSE